MKFTKCDHGIEKKGIEQFETVGKNGKYFCELRKKKQLDENEANMWKTNFSVRNEIDFHRLNVVFLS